MNSWLNQVSNVWLLRIIEGLFFEVGEANDLRVRSKHFNALPGFDSVSIHVDAAVEFALGERFR
ncbi:hypothetical protein ACOTH5_12040 [Achromobacter xylosoxidans]|uniref:hypothetical protein n=1 Tax=Achromobacter TaxID=222 RepID=UPI000AA1E484|nr:MULTISPECIES: hypothetical protein [Achromobacter]